MGHGTDRVMPWWRRPPVRRVLAALAALVGTSVLVWALVPLAPGDPAFRILAARGIADPSPEQLRVVVDRYGLDLPLPQQYLSWAGRAVRGDLGVSYRSGRPVLDEVALRLPATLRLAAATLLLSLASAVPAALVAARYRDRWPDGVLRVVAFATAALPAFLVGFLVLDVVVVDGGLGRVVGDGSWTGVWLPAATLSLGVFATWSRLLRSDLVEALDARFAQVLRARGLTERRILVRHALPVAAPTFLHAVGLGVGAVLSGAPVVEAVFTWPGLGSYAVAGVDARDLPVIQAYAILATIGYLVCSTLADAVAAAIDPGARA